MRSARSFHLVLLLLSLAVALPSAVAQIMVTTVAVGASPFGIAVNSVTNKTYVANLSCSSLPCPSPGTVTVIDGATNSTTTVTVGVYPYAVAVNPVTNKIYVANNCGSDVNCNSLGTVTVIDGATNNTATVNVGPMPSGLGVNAVTNKIYVGCSFYCDSLIVIDGATNNTATVEVGNTPDHIAVDAVTNKIYVTISTASVTVVIDGATNDTTSVSVGNGPGALALNPVTDWIYVANGSDNTVSVIGPGTAGVAPFQFVAVTPCRLIDTRISGGPIPGGTFQTFDLRQLAKSGGCADLSSAAAYSLNVTAVPEGPLGYLTVWPAGQQQPVVSTLNSVDGRVKANAAIVPAGTNGAVSVYVSNTSNVVLDIDGYFAPATSSTLAFYPLTPCRVADTRSNNYPQGLGAPFLSG